MPTDHERLPVPKLWAHRGFSSCYPENTLIAFQAAIDAGADGIELDVQWTSDGQIVVIHDATLDRTTDGTGAVAARTMAQVQQLDAGGWFDGAFRETPVPSFAQVAMWLNNLPARAGAAVEMNVELKATAGPAESLALAAWETVRAYNVCARTVFSSFDHAALRALRRLHPRARIAPLYMENLVDPWLYAAYLQAEALHPLELVVDAQSVRQAHEHGVAIRPFTVNSPDRAVQLCAAGVDALITDRPDVLRDVLRGQA